MAAAFIPLIAALGPEIINLIASLVHQKAPVIEQQLGPGTGPVKFADLYLFIMDGLIKAHAAGQIITLPDEALVKVIIQSVVSSMKLLGLLNSTVLPAGELTVSAPQAITIKPGGSLLVST